VEAGREPTAAAPGLREARYRYSASFPEVLQQAGCSLLVSTYQAGKLAAIGTDADGGAYMKTVRVNQENPVFNEGAKVYLQVVREHPLDK
jgi:hypothetical protein